MPRGNNAARIRCAADWLVLLGLIARLRRDLT